MLQFAVVCTEQVERHFERHEIQQNVAMAEQTDVWTCSWALHVYNVLRRSPRSKLGLHHPRLCLRSLKTSYDGSTTLACPFLLPSPARRHIHQLYRLPSSLRSGNEYAPPSPLHFLCLIVAQPHSAQDPMSTLVGDTRSAMAGAQIPRVDLAAAHVMRRGQKHCRRRQYIHRPAVPHTLSALQHGSNDVEYTYIVIGAVPHIDAAVSSCTQ